MKTIALTVLAAALAGCNPEQAIHPRPQNDRTPDVVSLNAQDREFIVKAAQGNNAEVATGGLVNGRSQTPAVIEFGRMMVADHGAANQRLAAIAFAHRIALPTSLGDQQAGYDRLVDRTGESFDAEFARVMVEDHQSAVRLYEAELTSGTDPALRQYAASTLPAIQAHLARAKTLLPLEDHVTADDRHVDQH